MGGILFFTLPCVHMEKVKEQLTKLPPALTLLKICCMVCGGALSVVGLWLFLTSILTFSFSDLIVGFYLIIGGIIVILAELQFKWFISRLNFLGHHFGRGVFYIFVGSLTFAVFGLSGVISVFLMIIGILTMICGIVQIVFQFIGHKFAKSDSAIANTGTGSQYEVTYGGPSSSTEDFYGDTELKDPNFDPNMYSGGINMNKPSPSIPQAGSPSQVGLQSPQYDLV